MELLPVLMFLFYTWGFGFSVTRLVKESEHFLERQLTRLGIGLSVFVVFGILMSALKIPLDWRLFFLAAMALPVYHLAAAAMNKRLSFGLKLRVKKSAINVAAVLIIFVVALFMYASGAFKYPYLEDDDPWSHAVGAKYVSVAKSVRDSPYLNFQYMDPYPPSYDMLFGILHQTSSSLNWTIKFFNALIISLSLVFFYFFAKEFVGDRNKALFATFVLASLPAYLSHFIWAPVLAMAVFFPTMYAFEMVKHDSKWRFVAAFCFAAVLLSQPTHAIKLTVLVLAYVAVKLIFAAAIYKKHFLAKTSPYFFALFAAALISLFWWAFVWDAFFDVAAGGFIGGKEAATQAIEGSSNIVAKLWEIVTRAFPPASGTASRPYAFEDFFVAKSQGLINNPVGLGVVASILLGVGLVAVFVAAFKHLRQQNKESASYHIIVLLWFVFTFLGVNSLTFKLPIGLFAFRFWMIFAVPVAILAAEGLWFLFGIVKRLELAKVLDKTTAAAAILLIITVAVAGVYLTSFRQKYDINTSFWPPGAFWTSFDELQGYAWLKTLPPGTKVFTFLNDDQVVGFDKFSCGWCKEVYDVKQTGLGLAPVELNGRLKQLGYEYMVMGGMDAKRFGVNETVSKINSLANSGMFRVAYQTNGAVVLQVI